MLHSRSALKHCFSTCRHKVHTQRTEQLWFFHSPQGRQTCSEVYFCFLQTSAIFLLYLSGLSSLSIFLACISLSIFPACLYFMKENLNANITIVNLMKGISSLVVILLIVLITITMFSLIYITTLGLLKESGESTQETFEKKQQAMGQKFAIDNANQNAVYIRNEGDGEISGKSLEFFVNNQHIDVISAPDSIASKKIGTFVLNATQLASFSGIRTELKVTGAGIGDTKVVMFNTTVTVPTTSTTTTLPGPIYLSVVLDTPPEGSSNNVAQNNTFVVRANVTCVGTGSCGNVNGTLWYNASGNEPDNPISIISGSVPLSIVNVFNVLDLQVRSGADDAEEYDSGASFFPAAGNVRIASDTGGFQTDGGFRFTNVTIPQGAVVSTATFQGYIFVASNQA